MHRNKMQSSGAMPLVVFAHIEKTGGTSLNGILRSYHGVRYAHVRALLHPADTPGRAVHVDDLQCYQRLVPWLRCVSGHAVRPWLLLDEGVSNCQFMTVLREPIARYVSYYTYGGGAKRASWPYSFEEYLLKENFHNFQTRRIAGCENAEAAIDIINKSFMAVSTLDAMNELIENLNIIWPGIDHCASMVGRRNVRKDDLRDKLINQYKDKIIENNSADLELYSYFQEKFNGLFLRPEIFKDGSFPRQRVNKCGKLRELVMASIERAYLTPLSGLIRLFHGLPYRGTY